MSMNNCTYVNNNKLSLTFFKMYRKRYKPPYRQDKLIHSKTNFRDDKFIIILCNKPHINLIKRFIIITHPCTNFDICNIPCCTYLKSYK